jgi:hypothetical protein
MSENQRKINKLVSPGCVVGFFRTTVTEPSPRNPTGNAAGVDGDFRGRIHNGIVAIVSKSEG